MRKDAQLAGGLLADPLALFAERDDATRARISLVIHRGCTNPSPYVSYSAWQLALADAYQARAAFWAEVVEWAKQRTAGVLFSVLLDARNGAEEAARERRSEARRADAVDAERAARAVAV